MKQEGMKKRMNEFHSVETSLGEQMMERNEEIHDENQDVCMTSRNTTSTYSWRWNDRPFFIVISEKAILDRRSFTFDRLTPHRNATFLCALRTCFTLSGHLRRRPMRCDAKT